MPAADRPKRTKVRYQPYARVEYGECPSRSGVQSRYFHASPSPNYARPVANTPHPDGTRWIVYPKPQDWLGSWPPISATQLMATDMDLNGLCIRAHHDMTERNGEVLKDPCLGKYCWQTTSWGTKGDIFCFEEINGRACDHNLKEWLTGCSDWSTRFEIRATPGIGHGLFSKVSWGAGEILGAYLGELVPDQAPQSGYVHAVHIGPKFTNQDNRPVAYVDAETVGNFVRFANHACVFNALIEEARVGGERVLAMRARRAIKAGEQVFIDYGDEYFGEGRWCCCEAEECKYKKRKDVVG